MEEMNLDLMPHTKALLVNYVKWQSEGEVDCDNSTLMGVWYELERENRLVELHTAEWDFSASPMKI